MCVEQAMKVKGLFKDKATTLLWRHGSSTSTPLCWHDERNGVSVTLNLQGGKTDRNDILGTAAFKKKYPGNLARTYVQVIQDTKVRLAMSLFSPCNDKRVGFHF